MKHRTGLLATPAFAVAAAAAALLAVPALAATMFTVSRVDSSAIISPAQRISSP